MNFFKKYWYLVLITLITIGFGVVILFTSQKLKEEQPVAPSVPQAKPRAVEPKCTLKFSFTISTPTPTPTGGLTPTPTPTGELTPTPTPTGQATPTPTPTGTPGPTPTPGGPTPTPTTPPTPQVPVSGTGPSVLGAIAIAGGFLLLLVGLAF